MDSLFDEMLLEIFGHLNLHVIKNCRFVCKRQVDYFFDDLFKFNCKFCYKTIYRWDDLISNSNYFMKNYQIILRTTKDCDKITEFRRKPQHVAILDHDAFCLDVFRKLNNLQSLTIDLS